MTNLVRPTGPMTPEEIEDLRSPTRFCDCAEWAKECPVCEVRLERHEPDQSDPTYLSGDAKCPQCHEFYWVDQMPLVRPRDCTECRLLATVDFLMGTDL